MSTKMKYYLILLSLLVTRLYPLQAQSLPPYPIHAVDSLFAKWNNTTPGCVVGIVRNDSLIYTKGYGMGNLEYDVPNLPSTCYDVGSISKQFTAYCIAALAKQNKLNLNDDIHKYLNWLAIKEKITIQHLLNHTSGIRDYFQLLAITGKSSDDAFTQQLAIHILSKEKTRNNKPGTMFLYSNSNYLLLAEIIKKVSGKTLRLFADSAIFKPLKMNNAYFSDDYTQIQINRAYSYNQTDSVHYAKAFATDGDVGPGNLFCNIEDMAKWISNFCNTSPGNSAVIKVLTQKGKLNNGSEISYAAGINVGNYRGWTMYEHSGQSAGFNTCVSVFPEIKMGFIVFANVGSVNATNKNLAVADLFLQNKKREPIAMPVVSIDSNMAFTKNASVSQKHKGKYVADDGVTIEFVLREKRFYAVQNNDSELLIKSDKHTFYQAFSAENKKFVFHSSSSGAKVADEYWLNHSRRLYVINDDSVLSIEELKAYAATYYCPELACIYRISVQNHRLVLSSNLYDDTLLSFDGTDNLFTHTWWMSHLQMTRNKAHVITGFEVNSSRVLHLRFRKIRANNFVTAF